ncbi:lectin E [Penaeus vannamei]|uniref:Lectin E n=1 Tax=Penaeus vannamei TaxID=6689 RepID=A0A3R7Q4Q2_PENVA|nr:C-type lectin domain family 17, member A-like [Penaeus vannamei]ROT86024.1 lectin E [Penaeus vannamei]
MRVVVAILWAVAGAVWALEEDSVGALYDEHFPPLHPNCTQSLTDLLLLRQEVQLKELKQAEQESAGILREMVHVLNDIKGALTQNHTSAEASCPASFRKFGDTCLYLAKDVSVNWAAARLFCQDFGGDLAHALGYVKTSAPGKKIDVWVGGTDIAKEGEWRWVSGEDMPRGTPFWGDYNYEREPNELTDANCAILHGHDDYLLHDVSCDKKSHPLCGSALRGRASGKGSIPAYMSGGWALREGGGERSYPPERR